jgi:hypothetical protein
VADLRSIGGRKMPKTISIPSLEEIRRETREEVQFLKETAAKYPSWNWPAPMCNLASELVELASADHLDRARILDFRVRVEQHIRRERLKGLDSMIWLAESLAVIASKEEADPDHQKTTRGM